ncbi:FAD-dependent thymidylate synthase [Clostridia bacterium]|nr:FAD-dependent thymidylate synthase [Clostridia bacterium]
MKIVKASVRIPEDQLDRVLLKRLERYARICYKSEDKMQTTPGDSFIRSIMRNGHESVIEHEKITLLLVTDRGVTHEVVRHRIGSYSQESTRYCNYNKEKFGSEITVIEPCFYEKEDPRYELWHKGCLNAEMSYFAMLEAGATPQEARSVLPNSLKTEIAVTYNMREWRHFLRLRADKSAHPQARELAIPILKTFQKVFPELFSDIPYDETFPLKQCAEVIITDELFRARD